MEEYVIHSFGELHEIIDRYETRIMIYRGVKSVMYDLVPKIGRISPPSPDEDRGENEQEIIRTWKERALPLSYIGPPNRLGLVSIGSTPFLAYSLIRLDEQSAGGLLFCGGRKKRY